MIDSIGAKVRQLRKKKHLTLKELSDLTGISIGFLSKLERGMCTVSVEGLGTIASCLNAKIDYFFDDATSLKEDIIVLRSFERQRVYSEDEKRVNYLLNSNPRDKDVYPKLVELMPGFNQNKEESTHLGQEFIYVLEGTLTLFITGVRYDLYPGDSAHFDSHKAHIWVNYTNMVVKILVITTPNLFKQDTM